MKKKKPIFKRVWFWVLIVVVAAGLFNRGGLRGRETAARKPEPTAASTVSTPKTTAKPTATPTEEPAETDDSIPAELPSPVPEEDLPEIEETVDLDADLWDALEGKVALNDNGEPLSWIGLEDGVSVRMYPRLQYRDGEVRISLDDLVACVEDWQLTDENGTVMLEAAGFTLGLYNEEAGSAATLDSMEIPMDQEDFDFTHEGHFINARFLAEALNGTAAWDAEEQTLILRISGKHPEE